MQQIDLHIKKNCRQLPPSQQTRRSIIRLQQNPPSITEPNIQHILALELSDTLINAAYNLSVTAISLHIQKLCDPVENLFLKVKCAAFESVKIFANRAALATRSFEIGKNSDSLLKAQGNSKIPMESHPILLTKQQQIATAYQKVGKTLLRMMKIISLKQIKIKTYVFVKLQVYTPPKQLISAKSKPQILQIYDNCAQAGRGRGNLIQCRLIDKQISRRQTNQVSYSLNKHNHTVPFSSSPLKSNKIDSNSRIKSMMGTFTPKNSQKGFNQDNKTSTCSQSNNSYQQSDCQKQYNAGTKRLMDQSSHSRLINLKIKVSPIFSDSLNSNDASKERELELLRKKYYKLVDQFKGFSERFLQVIKQE